MVQRLIEGSGFLEVRAKKQLLDSVIQRHWNPWENPFEKLLEDYVNIFRVLCLSRGRCIVWVREENDFRQLSGEMKCGADRRSAGDKISYEMKQLGESNGNDSWLTKIKHAFMKFPSCISQPQRVRSKSKVYFPRVENCQGSSRQ